MVGQYLILTKLIKKLKINYNLSMLKRKSHSLEDLKREIKKLKRKNQDAKELEIQLKQIINCKNSELARYER